MLIGSRQRLDTFQSVPNLAIKGKPVKKVPHAKSLGVHIDENISWNEHISQISKTIACSIGALKRVRHCAPTPTLHTIYNFLLQFTTF